MPFKTKFIDSTRFVVIWPHRQPLLNALVHFSTIILLVHLNTFAFDKPHTPQTRDQFMPHTQTQTKNMTHTTNKHMSSPHLIIALMTHMIPQHPTIAPNQYTLKHHITKAPKHHTAKAPNQTCISNTTTTINLFPKPFPPTHNPTKTIELRQHGHCTRLW